MSAVVETVFAPDMQNYFALFGLPEQFDLDKQVLEAAWLAVQKEVHPDRFVNSSESEKRAAMQWASLANDAYQVLRNPVRRATHLCQLRGHLLNDDAAPAIPSDFIYEQIEWREQLDNASIDSDIEALDMMGARLRERTAGQMLLIRQKLDAHDFAAGAQEIRKMVFLQKFGEEINVVFDRLDRLET